MASYRLRFDLDMAIYDKDMPAYVPYGFALQAWAAVVLIAHVLQPIPSYGLGWGIVSFVAGCEMLVKWTNGIYPFVSFNSVAAIVALGALWLRWTVARV